MRIRLTLEITRTRQPTPERPEYFESNGSLVEHSGQPRYTGFIPEEPLTDRARRSDHA